MPATLRKSFEQLKSEARRALENSGKITNTAEGGVSRTILDIGAKQVADLYDAHDFQIVESRLSTATGVFLDLIGQSRGVIRTNALSAFVTREDEAIKFFSKDGVTPLKTLLEGGRIPSGTAITSADGTVTYTVTTDVFVDDLQTEVFVPAVSSGTGASQNVGKGVLTGHNLGVGDVGVVNDAAIETGRDIEGDNNYRFRISRHLAAAAGATPDAIRLAAFTFPGVASIELREFPEGVGTIEVLVVPVGNRLPTDALRGIEALVRRVAPAGAKVTVRAPHLVPIEITLQLEFRKEATAAQRSQIRELVRQALLFYVGEVPIGGEYVVNTMIQRTLDTSQLIRDVRVLLFRVNRQNQVLRNFVLESDQLLVPDDSVPNPIRVL